jgi:GGDEF domain-containing protein
VLIGVYQSFPNLYNINLVFKADKDACNYPGEDLCWQKVASIFKETLKHPTHLVARYQGEEFAVVLPHTEALDTVELAEENCTKVRALKLTHPVSLFSQWITRRLDVTIPVPTQPLSTATLMALTDPALAHAVISRTKSRCYTVKPDSLTDQSNLNQVFQSGGKEANLFGLSMLRLSMRK